ncbi:MAG: PAS domain S-box protein [Verrucomicrobia bacterium]|nr:PAS domain S-box protein [Verrucomicrobiota bacterium]
MVEANAAFVTMLGYTRAELLQLNVADFDAQLSRAELLARIGALTPQPVMFETRHRRKDGTICEVEIYAVSLMLEGRKHCYASTRDITARKQTEQRLRLQGGALEAAANAIVITDREGNIEWVNAAFTTVTGYSVAEVVGKNPRLLKSGKHDPAFYQNLWDTICAGNAWRGEIINRRQDGSFYTEDIMITPLKDERGEITHFIAVKQDITQRKLLEEEFRQSQKMEAFGQLAGGVAHDFNNILTVIQGGAALLQMNLTAEDKDQAIQQIAQAAKRAAGLTSQLLSFSRRQIMHARPVDLNESVTAMGKMLQRLIGENITLQTRLLPGGAPVHADPGMIEQILLNLAVNARDAMPAGGQLGITLENLTLTPAAAALHHLARTGNFIRLTVQDTGAGIPPEILPRIFEPFFTTKDIGKGTGLGLATVHGIIQQHHGWVQVESEPGKGSTFHVFLPRLAGMHEIQSEEYRVIEAASGLAALETWRQHGRQVDLLLTDIIMPEGVSGSELVVQLQAAKPGLKIIYMSGYPGEVAGRGLELDEGTNFLQKPFTPAKLAQIVRDCLDAALKL